MFPDKKPPCQLIPLHLHSSTAAVLSSNPRILDISSDILMDYLFLVCLSPGHLYMMMLSLAADKEGCYHLPARHHNHWAVV